MGERKMGNVFNEEKEMFESSVTKKPTSVIVEIKK